jgi:hypothetical protein
MKLFVYGGLLSSDIRNYKHVSCSAIRNYRLKGWKVVYTHPVKNCKKSKYYNSEFYYEITLGMGTIIKQKHSTTYGKILYLNEKQLKRVLFMEPMYILVDVGNDIFTLQSTVSDKNIQPNRIYKNIVKTEICKIKKKFV